MFKLERQDESGWEKLHAQIDYEGFLRKYGPEGCYRIAEKLKEIADEDVDTAINFSNEIIRKNFEQKVLTS